MKGSTRLWTIVALMAISYPIKNYLIRNWSPEYGLYIFIGLVALSQIDYWCCNHYDNPYEEMFTTKYICLKYYLSKINKWADNQSWLSD